ncbi:MAG: MBL fold metallo-hydrolase, partial [Clostridia bacterium]|nr:MBL fold metallo-hydrolase [Clostridia bacterium]
MYELIQVAPRSYYIDAPAKIGLVKTGENEVCLIDSGNDKDAAKKVRKILNANGWHLSKIFNTHFHADHVGGNAYLQAQTGCEIYAPAIEVGLIQNPILEPALLYGGCPPKELRHKFLMAQPSQVHPLTPAALPDGWEMIDLPGHSLGMVGYQTPDDVIFLADSLASEQTLNKYGVTVLYDLPAYLQTLERITSMSANLFIPSHAAPTDTIAPLAQRNIEKKRNIIDFLLDLCRQPLTFEQILAQIFEHFALSLTVEQHVLVGSTIRSYLAHLTDSARLTTTITNNQLLWHTL